MISKRAELNDPQASVQIKNLFLADALPDLTIAAQKI